MIILITDGVSQEKYRTIETATATKKAGFAILVIGVGTMDTSQLRQIASQSLEDYFFTVSTFTKLQDILKKVVEKTCIGVSREQAEGACKGRPHQVVFVLDGSSSIRSADFDLQRNFVSGVIDLLDIGVNKSRVAVVSSGVKDKIATVLQRLGNTATGEALRAVRTQVLNTSRGYSPETPVVVIVVTDGKSQQPWVTREEAEALRNATVHTIVIGLEPDIDQQELNDIASSPPEKFVFKMTIYSALDSIKTIIGYKACTTGA